MAFMLAAALALPENADLARRVGGLAMHRAEHGRAESWLRRALTLARRQRAWECVGLCLVDLGICYRQRGSLPRAGEYFLRAYVIGCRYRKRRVAALAAHDLFGLSLQAGRLQEGDVWVERASKLYRPQDPEVIRLANDVAYSWLCRGEFCAALRVFRAVARKVHAPALQLIALSNVVRAAGGCGDRVAFDAAWTVARNRFLVPGLEEIEADCWLDMAHGAASLGDWGRAAVAARAALTAATRRCQNREVFAAQAVLESAEAGRSTQEAVQKQHIEVATDPVATRLVCMLAGVE